MTKGDEPTYPVWERSWETSQWGLTKRKYAEIKCRWESCMGLIEVAKEAGINDYKFIAEYSQAIADAMLED